MSDPVRPLPLADLHRHLDGSLRPQTLAELAHLKGLTVPADLRFSRGMGLEAALERFRFTLAVLQDPAAVRRVANEICEDAAAEGVSTLEIRFAPQLHRGASVRAVVEAAAEGVAGRAGLVLCGLYGQDPAVLEELVDAAIACPSVVGIDLAGGPDRTHSWGMADYAHTFGRARDHGIGRTVHAGEGRPPAEIREAIERLGAQRIGHGTSLLADPHVVDLVVERGVTIEACLTSNMHTGAIDDVRAHPIAKWLARGVRVAICTDNTLLSDVDARGEYARAAAIDGMTPAAIGAAAAFGHAAAFPRRT